MRLMRFFLPILALALMAASSKPKATVRFHVEVNPNSGAAFVMSTQMPNSNRPVTLSKVAEISEADIVGIFPFPADDGTIGCAFRLDSHGRLALDTLSSDARGATLVGFVNSRAVTAMMIDRRVSDGLITIARGLQPEDIMLLRKSFPVLGEPKGKKGKEQAPAKTASTPIPAPAPLPSGMAPRGD